MIRSILILTFASILSVIPTIADEANLQDTEKFEYLEKAIVKLRKKTIPEAYFWLGTPQAPNSTMFIPDTKGGGFVIIIQSANKGPKAKVFYKEQDWEYLLKATKKWQVSTKSMQGLFASSQLNFKKDEILVLQIPNQQDVFLQALLSGWRTDKKDFRCSIHWN